MPGLGLRYVLEDLREVSRSAFFDLKEPRQLSQMSQFDVVELGKRRIRQFSKRNHPAVGR